MKQKNMILMVVAVGCGLVAAFLTSQMSAKGQVEQVEVVVAAKDIPVGTQLTKDELKTLVKMKKMPKDGLPPAFVTNPDDLVDKKLARPVRAEETFNPQDLTKGGVVMLPEGHDMLAMPVGVAQAVAGFVGPGSKVDILATRRLGNKIRAFPLLVNMLVVAVDTNTVGTKEGTYPSLNTVSFAVREKEGLLLMLAKNCGCALELRLRHPNKTAEADKGYNIDEVIKLLSDDTEKANIDGKVNPDKQPQTQPEVPPAPPQPPAVPTVKVLVAKRDIGPNTDITKDLIEEAFEEKELPKDFAPGALSDLNEALGKQFKTGVAKGQWVTPTMVGIELKPAPQDPFIAPTKPPEQASPSPAPPADVKPVVKRKFHDVNVHTVGGTVVHRYEVFDSGRMKLVAILTLEQAARDEQPEAPKPAPDAKKVD